MSRLARVVVPHIAHHVTQRGNGRRRTFFGDDDYRLYRDLLGAACAGAGVKVLGYCLMPNHVHLILAPTDEDGLRRALAPVHRRYAGAIHAREKRTGHFWQGRFGAVALDEAHLAAAMRYVAFNPVRARLVRRPQDWAWSSVQTQLGLAQDAVTATADVRALWPNFREMLELPIDRDAFDRLRKAESVGRPLGDKAFLDRIEALTGRRLAAGKRGPKPVERA
jgi:putative transposase